jgi:hypothetical protein
MQTIQLEVKDDYFQNTLEILNGLKDIMIDKIIVNDTSLQDKISEDDFNKLSFDTLEEIWDNQEDSEYDKFLK